MNCVEPQEFKHTTLKEYPHKVLGVALFDEAPGFTGIYLRGTDARGNAGYWPGRTVSRAPPEHHATVINSWLAHAGKHEDFCHE